VFGQDDSAEESEEEEEEEEESDEEEELPKPQGKLFPKGMAPGKPSSSMLLIL